MGTDQYHEPPEEMDQNMRDFARVAASLTEEADAINWYEQRIAATKDQEVCRLLKHAQEEEFEHFAMALEWISRRLPKLREKLQDILFTEGDIVKRTEEVE